MVPKNMGGGEGRNLRIIASGGLYWDPSILAKSISGGRVEGHDSRFGLVRLRVGDGKRLTHLHQIESYIHKQAPNPKPGWGFQINPKPYNPKTLNHPKPLNPKP